MMHWPFVKVTLCAVIWCLFDSGDSSASELRNTSTNQELLLDRATGKWHESGTRGPCGKNMIFYAHPLYKRYGFCDCDQGFRSKYPCSDHPVRRMIYVPSRKQCFPVFSQGPCGTGLWLNFTGDSRPVCQRNPCPKQTTTNPSNDGLHKFWYYDPLRKSCYQTQTRGYCPNGLTLETTHDSHVPKCRKKICFSKLTNFRSSLVCWPGSRYSYLLKGCVIKPSKLRYASYIG